jgi:transposase InsO family protein
MSAFIDDHRASHGVEPICRILTIAPSPYHAHVAQRADPSKLSARARRDTLLKSEVRRVLDANFKVYDVRKIWCQLRPAGREIARCTVVPLMRCMGLQGVTRGKPVRTTVSDKAAPRPLDHGARPRKGNKSDRPSNIGACNTESSPFQPQDEAHTPLTYAASCAKCSEDGQVKTITTPSRRSARQQRRSVVSPPATWVASAERRVFMTVNRFIAKSTNPP